VTLVLLELEVRLVVTLPPVLFLLDSRIDNSRVVLALGWRGK
jgi:hypothetical protein